MRKTLMLAMLVIASTAFGTTPDKKKKKSKETTQLTAAAPTLATPSDTLSYAAGVAATRGLMEFISKEYGVDTAHIADFVEGFNEANKQLNDPKYAAHNAGIQIARLVKDRILPQTQKQFEDTPHHIDSTLFNNGFLAAVLSDTTVMTNEKAQKTFTTTLEADKKQKEEAYKAENTAWLAANAAKDGVKTTASGLQYKIITAGSGATPKKTDKVKVKYEGRLIDGTEFDSSYKRNPQTSSFRADQVIKGWTEALTMMPVGSKWELYIPQELAYGSRQAGKIKPYSTLIFTVELVDIEATEAKAPTENIAKDNSKAFATKTSKAKK